MSITLNVQIPLRKTKEINISGEECTTADVMIITSLLKNTAGLTKLNIPSQQIKDVGIQALGNVLKKNKTLKILKLCGSRDSLGIIGDAGAIVLTEAVRVNTVLTSLDLRYNPDIGLEASELLAAAIAESKWIQNFGDIPVYQLKLNTSNLEKLSLVNKGCGDTEALTLALLLKRNTFLKGLNLRGNLRIGYGGAKALSEALIKSQTIQRFGEIPVQKLKIENRKKFSFKDRRIGDTEAVVIASIIQSNKMIESVIINSANSEIPVKSFRDGIKDAQFLSDKEYRDGGAIIIASLLVDNNAVTALYLEDNGIGDVGAQAIGEAMKTNSVLLKLSLYSNQIADKGAYTIGEGLKINSTLEKLYLFNNSIESKGGMALGRSLKVNRSLKEFSLYNNKIGDFGTQEIAEALKTNNSLTKLLLGYLFGGNEIGKIGAKAIGEALQYNSTLTELHLNCNMFGDAGAEELSNGLKKNSTLKALMLAKNDIGDTGAIAIANALKINATLTKLSMYSNKIANEGAKVIAEGLEANTNLKYLYLSNNSIENIGAKDLAEALKINTTLLNITMNGEIPLARFRNKRTNSLCLSCKGYKDADAIIIASLLVKNNTLKELKLGRFFGGNCIGSNGAKAIGFALKDNHTLDLLFLSNNDIGDIGADGLADGLKSNSTLTELNLDGNNIANDGAQALAEALEINTTVTKLILSYNKIGSNKKNKLKLILKEHKSLINLGEYFENQK